LLLLFDHFQLTGVNVTIPLKEKVIPLLDHVHPLAKRIGAVNTIVKEGNELVGYNTDYHGIVSSLNILRTKPKKALILGNGGASKAVQTVLNDFHIPCLVVSRRGAQMNYNELNAEIAMSCNWWINCTPVGSPGLINDYLPLPYSVLTDEFAIFDLVYSDMPTPLLQTAQLYDAEIIGGQIMLNEQAKKAWMYFRAAYYKNL
jgi:shikimate dehydrogenase